MMGLIQPYANNHHNPSGPGDGRPTAIQIVEDQQLLGKWAGRVALVTGCSPGSIGAEIARAIHATGADVYITSRDTTKGLVTAQSILADGNPGKVEVIQLDLTSLESVRKAAQTFLEKSQSLHLLINNAGRFYNSESRQLLIYSQVFLDALGR
jgi:NAD(P)-dependent dehydrogenase (short-subunit alcohol dehydrogenase family)